MEISITVKKCLVIRVKSQNGFESLALHDGNHDSVINVKDQVFKKLQLWNDKNSNGKVDSGGANVFGQARGSRNFPQIFS